MSKYNVVMETSNSTVVAEYEPLKRKSDSYQSEVALEKEFIRMLTEQGYDYLEIHEQDALVTNLRKQLELLNDYKFTESEWERFFNNNITNNNDGIVEKTRKIQEDYIQVLKKDDGTSKNIYLLDKKNIHYVLHGHKHLPFFRKIDDKYIVSGGSSTGGLKESKSKYISYNLLKYDVKEKIMKTCLIFYDDKAKADCQRVEVYLFEEEKYEVNGNDEG